MAKKPKPPVDVILAANATSVPYARSVRGRWFTGDVRIIAACRAGGDIEPDLVVGAIFVHESVLCTWWWNLDMVADMLLARVAP